MKIVGLILSWSRDAVEAIEAAYGGACMPSMSSALLGLMGEG